MLTTLIRYYPNMTVLEARRTTIADFEVLIKAKKLANIDKKFELSMQAWLNQQVQATKKNGKNYVPYYKTFKDFFDYAGTLEKAMMTEEEKDKKEKEVTSRKELLEMAKMINNK